MKTEICLKKIMTDLLIKFEFHEKELTYFIQCKPDEIISALHLSAEKVNASFTPLQIHRLTRLHRYMEKNVAVNEI
jgi:hypothetical protein